jgi:glycosyltransferase involved in cell wall biosynthesis/SAM-dependent methyltransferase
MEQPIPASSPPAEQAKRLLNLGCGSAFHPDWINIDFHDHGGAVLAYDLRLGIPLPDATVDVVYHSHVLEHFTCEGGKTLLAECFRVLRPGGLLRIAVPDLENIARAYITALEEAKAGAPGAGERHQWMIIELIDQMVRTRPGGAMAEFWRRDPLPEEEFLLSRSGMEFASFRRSSASSNNTQNAGALPLPNIGLLQGGELHRWMYDEPSLRLLLEQTGFTGIARQTHAGSLSPDLLRYGLDAGPDGTIRKPDSLFMEAVKPQSAVKAESLPRVALLATTEAKGAGIATLRHHTSLLDAGVLSHMYVAEQRIVARNLHVMPVAGQRIEAAGWSGTARLSGLEQARQRRKDAVAAYPRRPEGLELFSTGEHCAVLSSLPLQEDFDIIHLHWTADFFNVAANLGALKGRPVVWTLHDMRPFTGGCHYAGDCRRFVEHCAQCPQLGSHDPKDLSFLTWRTQMIAYSKLDLHIVTPSAWLAGEVQKSSLLRRFPVRVIPNSQPLDIFHPLDRAAIRASLGFGPEEFVLLFAAQGLDNERKGGAYLLEALRRLTCLPLTAPPRLLLLGDSPPEDFLQTGLRTGVAGHVDAPEQMAALYNAADAVIVPSLEDNHPNVICEALGCGTPVVAFAAGGIPEMVRDGETGRLAPVRDVAGLLAGIEWAAAVKNDAKMRLRCRAFALETWNAPARARDYADLFRELANA